MMFIDNTILYLGEAIDRNYAKWPVLGEYVWPNYYIGETYEDEVNYLKSWITERVTWIDANIIEAENVSHDYSDYEILVYPNPVKDQANIYLYLDYSEKLKIEIFDLMGRKISEDEIIPGRNGYQNFTVDVSHFTSGYYVLRIIQKEKLLGRKNIIVTGN
jgi:phosphoenolpyruvate synthase/pyruvate phosphate dikinase